MTSRGADARVVDPHGQLIARASTEGDELVVADLDMHRGTQARDRWDFYVRRHPERYTALTDTQFASNRSETGRPPP